MKKATSKATWLTQPEHIALACILLASIVLRWHFFSGLQFADDFSYGVYAFSLFREPIPWDMSLDFRMLRFALLFPVALLFQILPPTEVTAVLYPAALSLATSMLVYLIGVRLSGTSAGLLAAACYVLLPQDALFGTMLMPDTIVPFFITAAVYAFIRAEASKEQHSRLWYLISGIAVFLAFNARENSYYFLAFYIPFCFSKARWKKGFAFIGAGFILPLVALYAFYWVRSGDMLYNIHLAEQYRDVLIGSGYIPGNDRSWYACFYFMFPGFFPPRFGFPMFVNEQFGVTFTCGIPMLAVMTILAIRRKQYNLLVLTWWFLVGYLLLEFGSISFTSYQMMKKLPRFLLIITPALAVGTGDVLARILKYAKTCFTSRRNRIAGMAAGTVVVVYIMAQSALVYVLLYLARDSAVQDVGRYRWAYYDVLQKVPTRVIYTTGGWWRNKLSFYYLPDERFIDTSWKRSEMLRDLDHLQNPSQLAGSYVIIDRTQFEQSTLGEIANAYASFGSYVRCPPSDWKRLALGQKIEIYEVPEGWTYIEPDGQELALATFRHALDIGDPGLAVLMIHPAFLASFTDETFQQFLSAMMNPNHPLRTELLTHYSFALEDSTWKLIFTQAETPQ